MTTKTLFFLPILFIAFGVMSYSVLRLLSYLKLGKPTNRLNNIFQRIGTTFVVAIGQSKILRDKVAGPLHAGIFWGFMILLASVVEAILEGLHHSWSLNFLGPIYSITTILTDVFCALIITATFIALWRRYISKIKRLQVDGEKVEAAMILMTIFTIVSSLLLQNIARIQMPNVTGIANITGQMNGDYSWAFRPIAMSLAPLVSPEIAPMLFEITWWIHVVLVLAFMNYLPFSKHLHVLTSVPNVFLGPLKPTNTLTAIDFEDETIEQYGAKDIEDFTWKTLLDGYTCTHCGRCTSVCPANQTGKVLDPRGIIVAIHDRTMDKAPLLIKQQQGKELTEAEQAIFDKKLIGDYIDPQALWDCTTCGACMQECPVNIEHVPAIVEMRRNLIMMEAEFPQELQPAYSNIENNSTPWAFPQSDRANWTQEMENPVQTAAENPEFDVLFWVGCAGSYDERAKKTTKAFAELMQIAGVNFAILGTEEHCSADPARRSGNEFLANSFVTMNVETMNGYNVSKIVTTCPHCFNTLKNEYPQFGGNYDVQHHTQFIYDLIHTGKLLIDKTTVSSDTLSYHDSCYLGRYNDEYYSPRALLTDVPGLTVLEVPRSKDKGLCCGAGGARMFMEETVGKRVNIERTEELLHNEPTVIAANCPFCMTMVTDGVKAAEKIDSVKIKDISEIMLEHVKR
ncbi:MAG: 4Fe-4S dicluster domain-containing protein [Candidatus Kapabacteria bacterium]|nr:4Fe-4S dicluster domain-containing protein [Candidatus Kapabacteria bacterium]